MLIVHSSRPENSAKMLPNNVTLFVKGLRHGDAIGKITVETTDDQQFGRSTDFDRMTIGTVWRK
jgi:hypothetical protein